MNANVLFMVDYSQFDARRKSEIFAVVVFVCDITDHQRGWIQLDLPGISNHLQVYFYTSVLITFACFEHRGGRKG